MTSGIKPSRFLFDAHAHLHRRFDENAFFDGARLNCLEAKRRVGLADGLLGVLALASVRGEDSFERVQRWVSHGTSSWEIRGTAEQSSMVVTGRVTAEELILLAGRQIATFEGLEVLAIGTRELLPDGLELTEALSRVRSAGALAVVPWGFGKWSFRRRRLLRELIERVDPRHFFLGDSGGRPRFGAPPQEFLLAKGRGIRILPGSDPLPLAGHVQRAGSFGAVLEGCLDRERPVSTIKRILSETREQPATYGTLRPLRAFLRDQVAMQLRKGRLSGTE